MAEGYSDLEVLERWLGAQPREVAVLIAARAALRVVPMLAPAVKRRGAAGIVLPLLRGIATSWVRGTWPTRGVELAAYAAADAAYDAVDAAYAAARAATADAADAAASHAAAAAALHAAAAAAYDDSSAANAAAATAYDASHVAAAADYDASRVANAAALNRDVELVESAQLTNAPLWPGPTPDKIASNWARLKSALVAEGDDWEVWTDWYEARLRGDPADEALEVDRLLIPDKVWRQGPKVVNAEIKRLIEEHRSVQADEAANLVQIPGAYSMRVSNLRLEAVLTFGEPDDPSVAEGMREELQEVAGALRQSLRGNLADADQIALADRLMAALAVEPDKAALGRMTMMLLQLQAHGTALNDPDRESYAGLRAQFLAMAEGLNHFLATYPEVRRMEASRAAMELSAETDLIGLGRSIDAIADKFAASDRVAPSAAAALREGEEARAAIIARMAGRGAGLDEVIEQRALLAEAEGQRLVTTRNAASRLLGWAKDEARDVGGRMYDRAKDSVVETTGAVVESSILTGLYMLIHQISPELANLALASPVFKALSNMAKRAEHGPGNKDGANSAKADGDEEDGEAED